MEFYNPIRELEWLYGEWNGKISLDGIEQEGFLSIKQIGSQVVEFDLNILNSKTRTNYEKCTLVYDRTLEICKAISSNHEGYIEFSEVTIRNRTKHTELESNFLSGINLPPNIKIQKKWTFYKNPKHLIYEVKMGQEGKIVVSAEFDFIKNF